MLTVEIIGNLSPHSRRTQRKSICADQDKQNKQIPTQKQGRRPGNFRDSGKLPPEMPDDLPF